MHDLCAHDLHNCNTSYYTQVCQYDSPITKFQQRYTLEYSYNHTQIDHGCWYGIPQSYLSLPVSSVVPEVLTNSTLNPLVSHFDGTSNRLYSTKFNQFTKNNKNMINIYSRINPFFRKTYISQTTPALTQTRNIPQYLREIRHAD